jgi:UDP-N-acetylmuramate: L-alanyl-gamma-D-glutamyl-meso-diaminopimelate ligase
VDVSGSDQDVYPPMSDVLARAGVKLLTGYKPGNLDGLDTTKDLVVVGNVIRADNAEVVAAKEKGFRLVSLPEFMERYMLQSTRNLVIAGTHGKTTTSSLLAHVLRSCGQDPSYFVGGVSHDLPQSFFVSENSSGPFVLEGDEYDTVFWDKVPKFNHYLPSLTVLTSVEFDHADIYPDLAAVKRAFVGLMERTREKVLAFGEDPNVREVMTRAKVPVLLYGEARDCDYRATGIQLSAEGARFTVEHKGTKTPVATGYSGKHNVFNALAVFAVCRELGLDERKVLAGLASAKGVKRRQEPRGEYAGITLIEDFAHHPTAVRETISALRAKFPGRRLLIAFEPRSATSRRRVFQKDYVQALLGADVAFVSQPYDQSRIAAENQFSTQELIDDLNRERKGSGVLIKDSVHGAEALTEAARRGDVVGIFTNGSFGGLIPKLIEGFQKKGS